MISEEIFLLYKSFTESDIKKFTRFLSSPYFNTNSKILVLFREIIKSCSKSPSFTLCKEELFKTVYPGKSYNYSTMRNLFFRLETLTEMFLVFENISRNKLSLSNNLLNELNFRQQNMLFQKVSKKLYSAHEESTGIDNDYFYNRYLFEINQFNDLNLHHKKTNRRTINLELDKLNNASLYLTLFFTNEIISNFLNTSAYLQNHIAKNSANYCKSLLDTFRVEEILKLIRGKDKHYTILELYAKLLKCFTEPDNEQHYSRLELFNIYEEFLERKLYKNSKIQYLPVNLFREILFLALKLKKFSWARKFIDTYSNEVVPSQREYMFNFGSAFYYYHIDKTEKALSYISKISYDYLIFKYDINSLLLQINYDVGNIIEIDRILHKYKEILRTDELVNDDFKELHQNFIKYYEKLVSYKYGNKKLELGYYLQRLINTKNVDQKEWLLSRYEKTLNKTGILEKASV